MSRLSFRLLVGLLAALPAWTALGGTGQDVSVGVVTWSYWSHFSSGPARLGLDVAYGHKLGPKRGMSPWTVRAGLRATLPGARTPLPLELFARLELSASMGPWKPAAGPEVGVSGLTDLGQWDENLPVELVDLEQRRVSPFYVAFGVAPLRLCLGAIGISALELQWGATLAPAGAAARFQLTYLKVGVSL